MILVTLLTSIMTGICLKTEIYGLWFIAAFLWGIWDSFSQTLCNTILSTEFETDVEPFAVFKFVQSGVIFAFLMFETYLNDNFTLENGK